MFSVDDAPWIQVACDRPEMAAFIPVIPSPYTIAHAKAFVRCDPAQARRPRPGPGRHRRIRSRPGQPSRL